MYLLLIHNPSCQAYNTLQQMLDSNTDNLRSLSQSTDHAVQTLQTSITDLAKETKGMAARIGTVENAQVTMSQTITHVCSYSPSQWYHCVLLTFEAFPANLEHSHYFECTLHCLTHHLLHPIFPCIPEPEYGHRRPRICQWQG